MQEEPKIRRYHGVEADKYWHGLLAGEGSGLTPVGKVFRRIPSPPRCKLCQAPFNGPFAPVFRLVGFRRWALNQQLCKFCVSGIEKAKGGTELSISLLFADVRGSTTLAETMSPTDFTAALDRFYGMAFEAVDSEDGVIDHIARDGVMALWVPGFVGPQHAKRAVASGRKLTSNLASAPDLGDRFPVGVGVHTGVAFAGVVGEAGSYDFTVLGDVPNTTARLGSAAMGGELAMSEEIVSAAEVDTAGLERRMLQLKGKAAAVPAWIEKARVGAR
jgi:adenylate cyclase